MGYDIHGDKPATPEGQYFGRSVFGWPDVVHVVEAVAREESHPCGIWYGAECYGNGLDGEQSKQLAAKLDEALASGAVAALFEQHPESFRHCSEADIQEFCEFLKGSGGFSIS